MAFGHSAEGNEMPRNYWMLVTTPANYVVTRDLSFALLGLPSYLRRKAESMTSGDRLLLYVSGLQRFGATVTLTSTCFEEDTVHWRSHKLEETFPYRVSIEPAVVLDHEVDFLDARQIGPRMEYVKKWTPERWPLAFHSTLLHLIPRKDFSLIEDEMKKIVYQKEGAGSDTT